MSTSPIVRRRGARTALPIDPANLVLLASLCLIVFACFFLIGRAASPAPRFAASPSVPATTIASAPLSAGVVRVPGPAGIELAAAKHGAHAKAGVATVRGTSSGTGSAAGTGSRGVASQPKVVATPAQPVQQQARSTPAVPPTPTAGHSAPAPTAGFDSSG